MTGTERLEEMLKEQQDTALLKVVDYLKNLKDIDDNIFLNEEKTLKGLWDYIKSKAKKQAINNVAIIEKNTVYKWAFAYFEKSNEELGIKKEEPIQIPKTTYQKPKVQETPQASQLTLF